MDLKDFSTYFDTNEFLFEEGKNSDHAFIIESGSVEVSHQRGDRKLILSILGEGDVLGEGAVIDKLASTATARAVEPTRVIAIPVDYINQKIAYGLLFKAAGQTLTQCVILFLVKLVWCNV